MSNEIETQETQETKSKGGRPKNPPAPTNSAEVRSLMATEVVRAAPDKDRLRFLGELLVSFEGVEARAETAASKLLRAITEERDTLLARVNELQPLAEQLPTVAQELADLRTNFDSKIVEARKELLEAAQQERFKAARFESEAREKLEAAQQEFTKKGYDALLDAMRDLVAANHIEQPDIWNLPKNVNPLFLTLWQGWTPIKAQLFVAFTQSYPEANEGFVQAFARCLIARLPIQGNITPDPVENRDVKIEVLTLMASRWPGVLEQVQKRVDETQINRQTTFLRTHYADMAAAQSESARRGEGRSPIGEAEPASITGCPPGEPHLLGCVCSTCQPGLKRRSSLDVIGGEENF